MKLFLIGALLVLCIVVLRPVQVYAVDNVAINDVQQFCDQKAEKWIQSQHIPKSERKEISGIGIFSGMLGDYYMTYENHHNVKLNTCVVHLIIVTLNSGRVFELLQDVDNNKNYGYFAWGDTTKGMSVGRTKKEVFGEEMRWSNLVKSMMEE